MPEKFDEDQIFMFWERARSKKTPGILSKPGLQGIIEELGFFDKLGTLANHGGISFAHRQQILRFAYRLVFDLEPRFPDMFMPSAYRGCTLLLEDLYYQTSHVASLVPGPWSETLEKIQQTSCRIIEDCREKLGTGWIPEVIFNLENLSFGALVTGKKLQFEGMTEEDFLKACNFVREIAGRGSMIIMPQPLEISDQEWLGGKTAWRDQLKIPGLLGNKVGAFLPSGSFEIRLANAWEIIFLLLSCSRGGEGMSYLENRPFRAKFDGDDRRYWRLALRQLCEGDPVVEIKKEDLSEDQEREEYAFVLPIVCVSFTEKN